MRPRIAALMLAPPVASPTRIGGFTLRPAQERTLEAILRAVREFGGALLADPPGTGKTVLALAAARALLDERSTQRDPLAAQHTGVRAPDGTVLVVAPAALRAQWLDSAARAELAIAFVSFESLSRHTAPRHTGMVIVDEAHHARTPTTRRYARLADCCLGAQVVLLTATPVVNRGADRDALLALFLGERSRALAHEALARCIVRGRGDAVRPTVRPLGVIGRCGDVPGLAEAIAALPPPLPLVAGPHAAALIAMSLAMCWRSSLAALDVALRRRIQRGGAMRDLLRSGVAPSRAMLRHWVLHDDATQLAMGALLVPTGGGAASRGGGQGVECDGAAGALATLDAHVHAVIALRARIRPHRLADSAARATALRDLARSHPDRRLVVFARHAETIRALYGALRTEPGVIAIVGSRVLAAAGRWSRDEVLRAIGPRARPPDAARAIRMVLATDVVAEGVEMHGVGIVVHADIPWTPARLEQRIGRVTRVGSPHSDVLEGRLGAPPAARALIRLGVRLRRKSEARDRALCDARAQARITTVLEHWRSLEHASGAREPLGGVANGDAARQGTAFVGAVRADRDAFIAVMRDPPEWLVGVPRDGRWWLSSAPRSVARLLRAAHGAPVTPSGGTVRTHEHRIARALERRAAHALASCAHSAHGAAGATTGSGITRRRVAQVRARFARILAHSPALARATIAARQSALLARLGRPLEVARERRLDALLHADLDDATFARRLGALLHDGRGRPEDSSRPIAPGRLHCLLILSCASDLQRAPALAPPSASPGTAALR